MKHVLVLISVYQQQKHLYEYLYTQILNTKQLDEFGVPNAGVAPVAPAVVSCATAADLQVMGAPEVDGLQVFPTY